VCKLPPLPTPRAEPTTAADSGGNDDDMVGLELHGWLVRTPLELVRTAVGAQQQPAEREYLLTRGEGYSFYNLQVAEGTVRQWAAAAAGDAKGSR
jgi:hypothetical protein